MFPRQDPGPDLLDFAALQGGVLSVLVPFDQVTRSRYPWRFRREGDGIRGARSPGSPPRITVEDTLLDLCDDGTAGETIGWVTQAVQSRRTTVGQLRGALQRRRRARHRQLLEDLLGGCGGGRVAAGSSWTAGSATTAWAGSVTSWRTTSPSSVVS